MKRLIVISFLLLHGGYGFGQKNTLPLAPSLPCDTCFTCDFMIIHLRSPQKKVTVVNCFYDTKEKCAKGVVKSRLKKIDASEKWVVKRTKSKITYFNNKGDSLCTEWRKNGEIVRKQLK